MRGGTVFTLMNTFLLVGEYIQPIFGGWNTVSFALCTTLGMGTFALLHMFSRRTVHEMRLLKNGSFVEIKYFNAFWVPHRLNYRLLVTRLCTVLSSKISLPPTWGSIGST